MNTKTLMRRQPRPKSAARNVNDVHHRQHRQDQNRTKTITETAHTGDPARSFKMLFQYEEAARYRSQEMQDQADQSRLLRDARLAQRMRSQSETGARRARRALAGLFLG
jgi:hypothetical protein